MTTISTTNLAGNHDPDLAAGLDLFLDDYCAVQAGQRIVVAYTADAREPATWIVSGMRNRHAIVHPLAMDVITDLPLLDRLADALPPTSSDVSFTLVTVERDTMSQADDLVAALTPYRPERWRSVRVINASREFFTHGMRTPSAKLSAINSGILHRLTKAHFLRITTPGGSDLAITLDSHVYRWVSNRGVTRTGAFAILPPGEVSTYPVDIEGVFVADGAFNLNATTALDARLSHRPVRVEIRDRQLVSAHCEDPEVVQLVEKAMSYPMSRNLGELGFGTNGGSPGFIPMNSHLNERRPGVHLGFGQHNQHPTVVPYHCPIHLDLIAHGAMVWVDDDPSPIDFSQLPESSLPHPTDTFDEDIDADCCGQFTCERE